MATQAAPRQPPIPRHAAPIAVTDHPPSSAAFDWLMASLGVLLMAGVIQDGWAHSHGLVDQSFLTPWHAILYSMMALNGLVLGAVAIRNRLQGYSVQRALPFGYWTALAGVILFAVGGVFDLWWHTLFGIETDINGLLSPTHLVLAFSAVLIFSGPIRSVARQHDGTIGSWVKLGPMILAVTATLTMLGFFVAYAQPIEDGFTSTTIQRDSSGAIVASLYATDARGASQTRLLVPADLDIFGVTVAPGGTRIAYRGQAPQTVPTGSEPPSDLYVAGADGSHAVRITHSGRHDTQPAWSPDGRWIAYISMPAGTSGGFSLRLVHPDGSADRSVVNGPTTLSSPAWSADSTRIAYASRRGLNDMLAVVDLASGKNRWLPFTKDASSLGFSGSRLVFALNDGSIRSAALDGSALRTLLKRDANTPVPTYDGRHLAYLANADGSTQVFVAAADGSHPHNVSLLSGMDAARPAWAPDGRLLFTASGRAIPERTSAGLSLAEAANLLQAVMLCGVLLFVIRRWRAPFGAFTLILTLFAVAMATQSDAYYDAVPAFAAGLLADAALLLLKERARFGAGFYAFAFLLPAVFFALYEVATIVVGGGGTSWTSHLLLGSPLIAGCAGLLIAFCYEPPLPPAVTAKRA